MRRLLRLKRYERPADPAYFEKFAEDFRHRQREEMLRIPVHVLVIERLASLFREFQVPRVAYSGALAAFAVLAAFIVLSPDKENVSGSPAVVASVSPVQSGSELPASAPRLVALPDLRERSVGMLLDGVTLPEGRPVYASSQSTSPSKWPRYVMDARPVSHEATFSF